MHECDRKASVLDVGPGRGKYGVLLREYVAGVAIVDAVEAWEPYVTDRLQCIYDAVFVGDVCDWKEPALSYDVVLMVDVLEHLTKPDGRALLDRIPGNVVICTPAEFFQNPEAEEIPPERHRSLWRVGDFRDDKRTRTCYVNAWGGLLVALTPK